MGRKAAALALGLCIAVFLLVESGFWPVMAPARPDRETTDAAKITALAPGQSLPSNAPSPRFDAGPAGATPAASQALTVVARRGDSLWRISQRMLGKGAHFKEIQAANSARIRDPRKIRPGQIFVLPKDP